MGVGAPPVERGSLVVFIVLCIGANLSYVFQFYLPLRMASSVEFRSTLSALIIFVPFVITFVPWGALWQRTGQRRQQQIAAPPLG